MKQFNVTNKQEIKNLVTSTYDSSYNYFDGDIRKGSRYARIWHCHFGNKCRIEITYWEDGKNIAVETASHCSTASGLTSKVAKFLNVK